MGNTQQDETSKSELIRHKAKTKKSVWKKALMIVVAVVVLFIVGSGAYAYYMYHAVRNAADRMYHPVNNEKTPWGWGESKIQKYKKNGKTGPISILLMGVDKRPHMNARSDTLIVLTLNPKKHKMQMVSIPRDTRIKIPGHGYQKINSAYSYGGPGLTKKTVKNYLNVPIDYYIRINFQGLVDLVNAVGGITVDNPISWHNKLPGWHGKTYKKGYFFHKGTIHLDGLQALGYVRMRHQDPRGDFGRNQRQRQVIRAIVKKTSSFSSFNHYQAILNAISKNVETDLTFSDIKYIVGHYRKAKDHISTFEIKGTTKKINGVDYVIVNDHQIHRIHNLILKQLGKK